MRHSKTAKEKPTLVICDLNTFFYVKQLKLMDLGIS